MHRFHYFFTFNNYRQLKMEKTGQTPPTEAGGGGDTATTPTYETTEKAASSDSGSTSSVDLLSMIYDHRGHVNMFNSNLAEAVALLRERTEIAAKSTKEWARLAPPPRVKVPDGVTPITFKEMEPEHVYKGRIIHLMNIEDPLGFEFECCDTSVTQHLSALLLLKDTNGVVNRGFIYNYVLPNLTWEREDLALIANLGDIDAKHLALKLGLGFKLSVLDPQLKIASDGKLALVVNDPQKLLVKKVENAQKTCRYCFKPNAKSCCVDCQKAYYCNKECESRDRSEKCHKLICITAEVAGEKAAKEKYSNVWRPNWVVYQLEILCYADCVPSEPSEDQLRKDFGFAKCPNVEAERKLLGLYTDMIKIQRVDMVKFHQAWVENNLEAFIKQCFESHSTSSKGGYYKWFLLNPSIVRQD